MLRTIFDAEHELFRENVRRFFQTEIGPHAERWREQGFVDREAYRKTGEQGYFLMWADEAYGGAGIRDLRYEQIVLEENMRYGDTCFYTHLHSLIVAPYIDKLGNAEQKARFLPKLVSGEHLLAIGMTEPGAGSDLAGMRTNARFEDGPDGGHWIINGSKTYISNGIQADLVILAARTSAEQRYGIGLFVVEAGTPGFQRGRKLKKMGLHGQDTAELFFDNCRVPARNLLGDPNKGFAYMAQFLPLERLGLAIQSIAHAQTAFDLTLDYVKERKAFGRPIGTFQNTRFKMAEMRTQLDGAQAFVDHCVTLGNREQLSTELASEAKLLTTDLEGRVVDECVQLHGGAGYMEEYRICRMYQDARITRIFAGTNEIMKEIIGRGLGLDERR